MLELRENRPGFVLAGVGICERLGSFEGGCVMATTTVAGQYTMPTLDWRNQWYEFEGVTYLNLAGNSPIPKMAIKALQTAVEWKKFPQRIPDAAFFEVPNRARTAI